MKANMDVVNKLARRYSGKGVDESDLQQEGAIGFLKGIRNWDPSKGAALRTYAAFWAETEIRRAIGTTQAGRLSPDPRHESLDAPLGDDGDGSMHDLVADPADSPEDIAIRNERVQMVLDATASLSAKNAGILRASIIEDVSNEVIGKRLGVSRERIRQMMSTSIERVARVAKEALS